MILNPDALLQPGSLKALLRFMAKRPDAGIVAPRLLNADGTMQRAAFRFPSLVMHLLDLFPPPRWLPGRMRRWLLDSSLNGGYPQEVTRERPFRIDHPLGACFIMARGAYDELGGFDPRIFMYSEEVDLAIRYKQAGWEIWQVPAARVIHLGGESTSQAADRMRIELWSSRVYLYRKHYSLLAQLILSFLLLARQSLDAIKLWTGSLLGKVDPEERNARWKRIRHLSRVAVER
jgi:GT2 family glycosyltransferase